MKQKVDFLLCIYYVLTLQPWMHRHWNSSLILHYFSLFNLWLNFPATSRAEPSLFPLRTHPGHARQTAQRGGTCLARSHPLVWSLSPVWSFLGHRPHLSTELWVSPGHNNTKSKNKNYQIQTRNVECDPAESSFKWSIDLPKGSEFH